MPIVMFCVLLVFFCNFGFAQNIRIEFGRSKIALNEPLTISIESDGERIEKSSPFPNVEGFKKLKGVTNATSTSNFEGKIQNTFIKTQTYHPQKEGKFTIRPFIMEVNGKKIESKTINIIVGAPDEKKGKLEEFSYEDLFNEENKQTLIKVQENAFLGLTVDKNEVYVGEPINLSLALYVAQNNTAPMKFYEIGKQVEEISKKLKPANCWEENFGISEIQQSQVEINGHLYDQYLFYQSTLYPFNVEKVYLPGVDLKMIVKSKIDSEEKNPNVFNEKSFTELKAYSSLPRYVQVKDLPDHPLKDKVVSGNFYLEERVSKLKVNTGESIEYQFIIAGQGNIASLNQPLLLNKLEFDFFPPKTEQTIQRGQGQVNGSKIFKYQVIPREAGKFALENYLQWIYFNLYTGKYDTLKPRIFLEVTGESLKDSSGGYFTQTYYQKLINESNSLVQLENKSNSRFYLQVFLIFVLILCILFTYLKVNL